MVDVEIVPRGDADSRLLSDLDGLCADLVEAGLEVEASRVRLPGVKADLPLAISIVNLGLSVVSTLVAVLAFWQSKSESYKVTIKQGGATYEVNNLNREQMLEIGARIAKSESPLVVGVRRT